jgi:hypothetical protein
MMREKCSYSFLRSLVKGQDHSFFKIWWAYFVPLAELLFVTELTCFFIVKSLICIFAWYAYMSDRDVAHITPCRFGIFATKYMINIYVSDSSTHKLNNFNKWVWVSHMLGQSQMSRNYTRINFMLTHTEYIKNLFVKCTHVTMIQEFQKWWIWLLYFTEKKQVSHKRKTTMDSSEDKVCCDVHCSNSLVPYTSLKEWTWYLLNM